ncbi:MAG: D-glycero-beta-D-manno-heptose 1-phosphate adenylyltransferase [Crocinitomicaceae bacterium]|nr:D-glycero-beta-D-manno-heptose 1-phosphate adenylyltransferase [Crocinitomicaceae bacterium]|tara:strand:+ start:5316 stop:5840 length:525 start_codon:yes stop_codon:yes gene_type:complete
MTSIRGTINKIHSTSSIQEVVGKWKEQGDKVVFTNGCFDLIHLGHITYLSQAAGLGSRLVVGINSDKSVRRLNKGASRPIKDEETRIQIMASFQFVDAVVMFEEDTPLSLIQKIEPAVLVKGGDYDASETNESSSKYIVGSNLLRNSGGKTKVLPFLPGHSTTQLEKKIIQSLS